MHTGYKPECRGQEGGEGQDLSNTFLILPSSYRTIHCSTLPMDLQRRVRKPQATSKMSRPVRLPDDGVTIGGT
jgi:hypothetical protein